MVPKGLVPLRHQEPIPRRYPLRQAAPPGPGRAGVLGPGAAAAVLTYTHTRTHAHTALGGGRGRAQGTSQEHQELCKTKPDLDGLSRLWGG